MVTILSTNTQPHDLAIVQCREHNGTRVNVQCPTEMVHYQDFMGMVDRNYQLRQYYNVRLKCRNFLKIYIYNFFPLFVAAIANSFILHTHTTPVRHGSPSRSSD